MMRLVLGILVAALLMLPRTSAAQTDPPGPRIFLDVNLFGSTNTLAGERVFTSPFVAFGEPGSLRATYPAPAKPSRFPLVDLGGGLRLTRSLAIGVGYSRTTGENAAGLEATVPHPIFFGAPAAGTGTTDAFRRTESATHIFAALVLVRTNRTEVRVFGGPSFFSYAAEMVQDVSYVQAFNPSTPEQTVTIDGYTSEDATGRGIGFHAGADFAHFFTRMVGVTGGVRFSRGTVRLDREPLSGIAQEIRVGGTLVFVGVRFRFGR